MKVKEQRMCFVKVADLKDLPSPSSHPTLTPLLAADLGEVFKISFVHEIRTDHMCFLHFSTDNNKVIDIGVLRDTLYTKAKSVPCRRKVQSVNHELNLCPIHLSALVAATPLHRLHCKHPPAWAQNTRTT